MSCNHRSQGSNFYDQSPFTEGVDVREDTVLKMLREVK